MSTRHKRNGACGAAFFFSLFLLTSFGVVIPGGSRSAYADDAWVKLGRGAGNVTFGWLEIFNQPIQMAKEERWPIAFFGGLVKGCVVAVGRTLAGAYEVLTFPIPLPRRYEPVMRPEFVIPKPER